MAPSNNEFRDIAAQAERDLNSYQAKTGNARSTGLDDAGVDSMSEKRFPGSEVKYHPDISTNAGYNRRIPPEEGGDLDDRGRQTRGSHFEGSGGPEHKQAALQRDQGGNNDNDVLSEDVLGRDKIAAPGKERRGNGTLEQGVDASKANVGRNPPGVGGAKYRGDDYYRPESVPDSVAAEGYIPPESVTQSSRETEGYY